MSQHYIPAFYLRMFSMNPKDRQSRQKVFCLNKRKEISKEKIDEICTFDGYNTEEQEEALSKLESKMATALRNIVYSDGIEDSNPLDILLVKQLTALLITNTLQFRTNFSEAEMILVSKILGDEYSKYVQHANPISGRLNIMAKCTEKVYEELIHYSEARLYFDEEVFITSDSPVMFDTPDFQYIIDFQDIHAEPILGKSSGELEGLRQYYEIERIRIPASRLYIPLSRNTLFILSQDKEELEDMVNEKPYFTVTAEELNLFNLRIYGGCNKHAFSSSKELLEKFKDLVSFSSETNS